MSSKKHNYISSLDEFHHAVLDTLKNSFGDKVKTISAYKNDDHHIVTPSIFFDITEIRYGSSRDDRLPVELSCLLLITLSNEFENVDMQIRNFAVETIKVIEDANFGLTKTATIPANIVATPEHPIPEKPATTSFSVTWTQTIHLERETRTETPIPCRVFVGFDPDIGKGHEKDYEQICDNCSKQDSKGHH